jgi:hypothetical protein
VPELLAPCICAELIGWVVVQNELVPIEVPSRNNADVLIGRMVNNGLSAHLRTAVGE